MSPSGSGISSLASRVDVSKGRVELAVGMAPPRVVKGSVDGLPHPKTAGR